MCEPVNRAKFCDSSLPTSVKPTTYWLLACPPMRASAFCRPAPVITVLKGIPLQGFGNGLSLEPSGATDVGATVPVGVGPGVPGVVGAVPVAWAVGVTPGVLAAVVAWVVGVGPEAVACGVPS